MVGTFYVFANGTLYQLHFDRHKYGNGLEMWFSNENGNSWASCFIPKKGLIHRFSKSIPVLAETLNVFVLIKNNSNITRH